MNKTPWATGFFEHQWKGFSHCRKVGARYLIFHQGKRGGKEHHGHNIFPGGKSAVMRVSLLLAPPKIGLKGKETQWSGYIFVLFVFPKHEKLYITSSGVRIFCVLKNPEIPGDDQRLSWLKDVLHDKRHWTIFPRQGSGCKVFPWGEVSVDSSIPWTAQDTPLIWRRTWTAWMLIMKFPE